MFMTKHRWPALVLLATLTACGPKQAAAPAPLPAPAAAQEFLAAFNKAEARIVPPAQARATRCAGDPTRIACQLVGAGPAGATPLTLTLSLDGGGAVLAATVEGAPVDDARLFGALSALAAAEGEPLATNATIEAFRRDLGLASALKPGKSVTAHRSYGAITCALTDAGAHACTFTPTVSEGDLPPPQLTAAHGRARVATTP